MENSISIFWHRRDLRLFDNCGAYHALKGDYPVLPLFIFDKNILDKLEDKEDARVNFIHDALLEMKKELEQKGSSMLIEYGKPEEIWPQILKRYRVQAVYTNHDYEPYALERDEKVKEILLKKGIDFHSFKDHVIFEKLEITKKAGGAYTVFSPYGRAWRSKLAGSGEVIESPFLKAFPNEQYFNNYFKIEALEQLTLEEIGFKKSSITIPPKSVQQRLIKKYDEQRNFPGIEGTSRLGIHFRFGTISIREKARKAIKLNDTYLNELIWREFYAQILYNFPHVASRAFRPAYEFIEWENNEEHFQKWCEGKTGYPIVDAGMRELNATGYMHNRVRMITASFLTKHLLIDWRWGEAYFAKKLLDFDLASNNGGWQWAAGCGTDAAPYFRLFNPYSQQEKFDKNWVYIKKWVPEVKTDAYPVPIVEHKWARERCLSRYKEGLELGKKTL